MDRETLGNQLSEIQKVEATLKKVQLGNKTGMAHLGSLIRTDRGVYFLSISMGSTQLEETTYYCIAPGSPIGRLLLGKKAGDTVWFRDQKIILQKID